MSTVSGNIVAATSNIQTALNTATTAMARVETRRLIIQGALSALVGTYGLVKQHQMAKKYLDLAKEQVVQAERYLALAESNYTNISVPTFKCQKDLFTRYLSQFGGYEVQYLKDAFRLEEYTPDYKLQEGRAISFVAKTFDKARLQRSRQIGRYNAGRACHDATMFSIQEAQAKVAAINHAYRFEENRKFKFDQWYWQRRTQGITTVDSMASRVVSGLNGGASVGTAGINAISGAQNGVAQAFDSVTTGFNNLGNFYGGIANAGFNASGQFFGQANAGGVGNGVLGLPAQTASIAGSTTTGAFVGTMNSGVSKMWDVVTPAIGENRFSAVPPYGSPGL